MTRFSASRSGSTLHVMGEDEAELQRAIAPYLRDPRLGWSKAPTTLEDVFLSLTGRRLRE